MKAIEDLKALLKNKKLRVTTKRLQLLTLIANYGSAIPYSSIQKSLQNFDRVTLYRALNTLNDVGIIHRASIDKNEVYYAMCKEGCSSKEHHHEHIHFKCSSCLEVSCVAIKDKVDINLPSLRIDQINIEATGICAKCL